MINLNCKSKSMSALVIPIQNMAQCESLFDKIKELTEGGLRKARFWKGTTVPTPPTERFRVVFG